MSSGNHYQQQTQQQQQQTSSHSNAYYAHLQQMQHQLASQHAMSTSSGQGMSTSGGQAANRPQTTTAHGNNQQVNNSSKRHNNNMGSTSPHKVIQPHQKRDNVVSQPHPPQVINSSNSASQQMTQQKMIAKRAAAKVVRRKINESHQTSKSMISQQNVTSGGYNVAANVTNSEANPNNGTGISSNSPHMTNPISNKINNYTGLLGSSQGASQLHSGSSNLQKIGTAPHHVGRSNHTNATPHHVTVKQLSIQHSQPGISLSPPSHAVLQNQSTAFGKKASESGNIQGSQINVIVPKRNLHQASTINKSKSPPLTAVARMGLQDILNPTLKTSSPKMTIKHQQPFAPQPQQAKPIINPIGFQKIEVPPLQQQRRGIPINPNPSSSNSVPNQKSAPAQQVMMPRNQDNGEKKLNKKQQMLIPQGGHREKQNLTRSLIEDGSEDFTNIEEHLMEDTRISCRQAVASSLQNVSQLIRQNAYGFGENNTQYKVNSSSNNIRGRRVTTHSNISIANKPGEDTFESSSFFDEGIPQSNRFFFLFQSNNNNSQPPHKCQQVDNYNLPPTIFNTLMFGIDQTKVSSHVRESFSKIKCNASGGGQVINTQSSNKTPQKLHEEEKFIVPTRRKSNTNKSAESKSEYYAKSDNHSAEKGNGGGINQFVTKVDKIQNFVVPFQNQKQAQEEEEEQFEGKEQHQNNQPSEQAALSTIEDFQSSELHRNHLIQTLQSLQYIKSLPPANKNEIKARTVKLPAFRNSVIKKTIIFDLDETLVHCIDDIEKNPCDQEISVTFPNGENVKAGINIRPYAIECLKKANESYQVVVFTASHRAYADVVLDLLDPTNELIQYRLYRDHCIRTEEGIYVKDLRIISNRDLNDLIIVDNAVYSFGYQLDNGIPIIPFYDDKTDEELMHLIFYFNCLAQCEDVREQNRKAFQLQDLQEIDIAEYLHTMMNNKNQQAAQSEDEDQTSGGGTIQQK